MAASGSTGGISRPWTEDGGLVTPERAISKPARAEVLMHRAENGRLVSFFGDLHPSFFGNVVKAMGSAKRGYPVLSRALAAMGAGEAGQADLIARCRDELTARVPCGEPADPDHHRGGAARPGGG